MIDLLSVLITFLVATAVLIELAALPVDLAIGEQPAPAEVRPPPLTVHVTAETLGLGRTPSTFALFPRSDWAALERGIADDRARHPEDAGVVVVTDDGVAYRHMIHAIDLAKKYGYDRPMLAGGPPTAQ